MTWKVITREMLACKHAQLTIRPTQLSLPDIKLRSLGLFWRYTAMVSSIANKRYLVDKKKFWIHISFKTCQNLLCIMYCIFVKTCDKDIYYKLTCSVIDITGSSGIEESSIPGIGGSLFSSWNLGLKRTIHERDHK